MPRDRDAGSMPSWRLSDMQLPVERIIAWPIELCDAVAAAPPAALMRGPQAGERKNYNSTRVKRVMDILGAHPHAAKGFPGMWKCSQSHPN